MPRGRVKVKRVFPKGSAEDAESLNTMFAQMTGAEDADPDIIIPKFIEINQLMIKYSRVFDLLLNFKDFIDSFPEYKEEFNQIKEFNDKIKDVCGLEITEESLKKQDIKTVNEVYSKLKQIKEVQMVIMTSGNMTQYKKYLEDSKNLSDSFIHQEPGLSLTPLKFSSLDFKKLWSSEKLTEMAKKYILNILSHTYTIGHKIYSIITSPDIDIKKFSTVMIVNIEKMKKQIPRCDKAFDIIANSVHLLENNFSGYYRTSVEAENPSIIIENFIVDVSVSQKASASTTAQFRKIIMFMKRKSAGSNDPRVAKLFKVLNNQFNMMQKETGIDESDPEDQGHIQANQKKKEKKEKEEKEEKEEKIK